MASNSDILFEIDGFVVRENSSYVIKEKEDESAPAAFREEGVTKIPSRGIGESFQCPFVSRTPYSKEGRWMHGFDEYAACYSSISNSAAKTLAKERTKRILEPFLRKLGKLDLDMDSIDAQSTLWENENFFIENKKILNTNDPVQVMTIYLGLLGRNLAPQLEDGSVSPKYNKTPYLLVDISKNHKVSEERASKRYDATFEFESLYRSSRGTLIDILFYLNIRAEEDMDKKILIGNFDRFLDSHTNPAKKASEFLNIVNKVSTDAGVEEVRLYKQMSRLFQEGKIAKNADGYITYEGEELGPDLKQSAERVATLKKFTKIKSEIILND